MRLEETYYDRHMWTNEVLDTLKMIFQISQKYFDEIAINISSSNYYDKSKYFILTPKEATYEYIESLYKDLGFSWNAHIQRIEILNISNKVYYISEDLQKVYFPTTRNFLHKNIKEEGKYIILDKNEYNPKHYEIDIEKVYEFGWGLNIDKKINDLEISDCIEELEIVKIINNDFQIEIYEKYPDDPGCGIMGIYVTNQGDD